MDNKSVEFWENRYRESSYAYGTEPNLFLAQELQKLAPGKILFGAEGEGRNAIFAATQGWDVTAFDISSEGKKKALQLAKSRNITIDYQVGNLPEFDFEPNQFDVIALIYAHFPATIRLKYFKILKKLLKSKGSIIFEGFGEEHLKYRQKNPKIGGPKNQDDLFSQKEIQTTFTDYNIILLEEKAIELKEGLYHNGTGSVLRFIGQKP